MVDGPLIAGSTEAALALRVARLAALLETHPGVHLLAEYEALFLDRHCCAGERVSCLKRAAGELLARVDAAIAALEAAPAVSSAAISPCEAAA